MKTVIPSIAATACVATVKHLYRNCHNAAACMAASIAIHAAVIGMAAWINVPPETSAKAAPVYFFETFEEAVPVTSPSQATSPPPEAGNPENIYLPSESNEPDAMDLSSATGPHMEMETQPEEIHLVDVNMELTPDDFSEPAENPEMPDDEMHETPEKTSMREHIHVVAAPQALGRIVPAYPRSARRRRHEGNVVLDIIVSQGGDVVDVAVAESSGYQELDAAALDAARNARFAPATKDGLAIEGRIRLAIWFKLK